MSYDRSLRIKSLVKKLTDIQETEGNLPIRVSDDWSEPGEETVEGGFDVASIEVQTVRSPEGNQWLKVVLIRTC